nr:MAG TPA: Nuclease [Caudoviricetes sp.]
MALNDPKTKKVYILFWRPRRKDLRTMTKTPLEKDVEKYLVKQCAKRRWLIYKFLSSETGVPDRIVILPGGVVWFLELKRARGGRLSARQKHIINKLDTLGANVAVLYGHEGVAQWLADRDSER